MPSSIIHTDPIFHSVILGHPDYIGFFGLMFILLTTTCPCCILVAALLAISFAFKALGTWGTEGQSQQKISQRPPVNTFCHLPELGQ